LTKGKEGKGIEGKRKREKGGKGLKGKEKGNRRE
jgi:hypothetical protein